MLAQTMVYLFHLIVERNEEKPLIIFGINDLRHSNSWGKRSNYSDDVFNSSVKTIVYSDKSIVHDYTITDNFNNILNKGQLNFDKGFNNVEILPIINHSIAAKKLKKIGISSEKSEDGNIYLSKGDFIL